MKTIIKFLTDCYQFMIVLGFVGSIIAYLAYVLLHIVMVFNMSQLGGEAGADVGMGIAFGMIVASLTFATIMEGLFLVALGGAAILVDIRNEIAGQSLAIRRVKQ